MNDYSDAINRVIQEAIEVSRDYGRLLAQAGIPLQEFILPQNCDPRFVQEGYQEQLRDYPNG